MRQQQAWLFPDASNDTSVAAELSSTFVNNMTLPVHRWFRYSAGFSAKWVEEVIRDFKSRGPVQVFDPFAGSSTTLLAAETEGVELVLITSVCLPHQPGKLHWRSDPDALQMVQEIHRTAELTPQIDGYPPLIYKCDGHLADLDTCVEHLRWWDDSQHQNSRGSILPGLRAARTILPRKQRSPNSVCGIRRVQPNGL
jgi:hypothetical protein